MFAQALAALSMLALFIQLVCLPLSASALTQDELLPLIDAQNTSAIQAAGPPVIEQLVKIYETASTEERTKIASVLYGIGWKSESAKRALMKDITTPDEALRLQVQWALGRVSNDDDVVDHLLKNMRDDPNPLFRDKAACALAHDQIHLTEKQKSKLYAGVIDALEDEKPDVRRIAGLVLQIQTGQTKNYDANGSPEARAKSIAEWRSWLKEYEGAVTDEK